LNILNKENVTVNQKWSPELAAFVKEILVKDEA
jgi:hypothetical protein